VAHAIFEQKILTGTVYSRESACSGGTKMPTPFHPSDFWFMGLTSDLRTYFMDTPLMPDQELAHWPYKYPHRLPYVTQSWRYAPEQYYLVSFLKRHLILHLPSRIGVTGTKRISVFLKRSFTIILYF
jgi:hypothetical protein